MSAGMLTSSLLFFPIPQFLSAHKIARNLTSSFYPQKNICAKKLLPHHAAAAPEYLCPSSQTATGMFLI
jgi:hypothetical protein